MKVYLKYEEIDYYKNKIFRNSIFEEQHEHRPRTVLDQLYNYKGGIVPNAAENEKPSAGQKVWPSFFY
jgi:hypothetical protein